jgi:hypothetical protein
MADDVQPPPRKNHEALTMRGQPSPEEVKRQRLVRVLIDFSPDFAQWHTKKDNKYALDDDRINKVKEQLRLALAFSPEAIIGLNGNEIDGGTLFSKGLIINVRAKADAPKNYYLIRPDGVVVPLESPVKVGYFVDAQGVRRSLAIDYIKGKYKAYIDGNQWTGRVEHLSDGGTIRGTLRGPNGESVRLLFDSHGGKSGEQTVTLDGKKYDFHWMIRLGGGPNPVEYRDENPNAP